MMNVSGLSNSSTACLFAIVLSVSISVTAFAQKPRIVTAAEANGTYRSHSNEISILALGGGRLKVQFDLTYEYRSPEGPTANTGVAAGEATIENNVAVFAPKEFEHCKITMTFLPGNRLKVVQEGADSDCGFGLHVTADGTYQKVSRSKPKFE
jgi:hypothetical protein